MASQYEKNQRDNGGRFVSYYNLHHLFVDNATIKRCISRNSLCAVGNNKSFLSTGCCEESAFILIDCNYYNRYMYWPKQKKGTKDLAFSWGP